MDQSSRNANDSFYNNDSFGYHLKKVLLVVLKFITSLVIFIIHPKNIVFPIAISVLFTIVLFKQSSSNYYPWVKSCIEHPEVVYSIVTIWIIASLVLKQHDIEIANKDCRIRELEAQINRHSVESNVIAKQLSNKFGEFGEFSRNIVFRETLSEFVNSNKEIDSCQIYNYSIRRIGTIVHLKVQCIASFAYEGVELNSITQSYFQISLSEYETFQEILQEIDDLETTAIYFSRRARGLINRVKNKIENLHDQICAIDILNISSQEFCLYRLLTAYIVLWQRLDLLLNGIDENKINDYVYYPESVLSDDKHELEEFLKAGKRTGIFACILMQSIFGFAHDSSSVGKDGRTYISFPASLFGSNVVVLYSSPKQDMRSDLSFHDEASYYRSDFYKKIAMKN